MATAHNVQELDLDMKTNILNSRIFTYINRLITMETHV